ncbi:hypothetical protein Taro_044349, partial [Colocasia esculenta]|nr:hypothetical protein [Colocasia esculenta]
TRAFGGSRLVSSRYDSSVLGFQSAVAPARMASRLCGVSGVRGGSACGPSTLWRSKVAVLEVSPRTVLCSFLVFVALPSRLRCIAWLPCVLVRFPRTVCCCPGESFSQDCFALVHAIVVLPQSLRCAVGLAAAFWQVFPERCLGCSGGGSYRTSSCCFCSSACCSVLSDGLGCSIIGLCILVKVLPRIALCRFRWMFFLGVLY